MVKDVVKSEYRMIDMWSLLFDAKHARNYADMWSALQEEMITMWSGDNHAAKSREPPRPSSAGVVL
jgi:3-oxoacyl-ACP reductase-like protein